MTATLPPTGATKPKAGGAKYYALTATGHALYEANIRNWDYAKQILDELL